MEKVVVKSRVYNNHKIMLNGGPVQFVGGRAEVSEELYQEIVSREIPDIYKEGEEPEYKTRLEEKLRSEVKEGNQEFEEEIKRLKNIIEAQKVEISRKEKEVEMWKKCVEELKAGKQEMVATPEPETKPEEEIPIKQEEDDEVKTVLKKMKVDELKELAMTEDGGSFKEEDLKGKKKEEIIDMILSK